jgi:hypothetical protein
VAPRIDVARGPVAQASNPAAGHSHDAASWSRLLEGHKVSVGTKKPSSTRLPGAQKRRCLLVGCGTGSGQVRSHSVQSLWLWRARAGGLHRPGGRTNPLFQRVSSCWRLDAQRPHPNATGLQNNPINIVKKRSSSQTSSLYPSFLSRRALEKITRHSLLETSRHRETRRGTQSCDLTTAITRQILTISRSPFQQPTDHQHHGGRR